MTFELPDTGADNCVFCSIIDGDSEASWEARPTGNARVACFQNRLKWARVMLLVVPTEHISQQELWSSEVILEAAKLAVEMGEKHCADEGFRLISNFGLQAHQSQSHGHIHVISGTSRLIQNAVFKTQMGRSGGKYGCVTAEYEVEDTPFAVQISPEHQISQREMWSTAQMHDSALVAIGTAFAHSPNGFRLMSSFEPAVDSRQAAENDASLFLLGGGQLGLYV